MGDDLPELVAMCGRGAGGAEPTAVSVYVVAGWMDTLTNASTTFVASDAAAHPGSGEPVCSWQCSMLCSVGTFSLLQLTLDHAVVLGRSSSLLSDAGAALQRAFGYSLVVGQLRRQDVLCMRAYFCRDLLSEEEVSAVVLTGFQPEHGDTGDQEQALWQPGPVLVPVVAVGSTPAVGAAIHIVALALRT